jgi:hypothetical protein
MTELRVKRFRSKVVEIEAWQFQSHAQYDAEAPKWLRVESGPGLIGKPEFVGRVAKDFNPIDVGEWLAVGTLEGVTYASPGHWIIRGTEGELCPCKPSVFDRKYEPVPDGMVLVPSEPTEAMWGGLARAIVMWWGMGPRPTGALLYKHLELTGETIPDWLRSEIPDTDHVPPKGTVAVCIYRAMLDASPTTVSASPAGDGWQDISTAPKDGTVIDAFGSRNGKPMRFTNAAWVERHMGGTGEPLGEFHWVFDGKDIYGDFDLTHWRPLPAPPPASSDDGKRKLTGKEAVDAIFDPKFDNVVD